MSLVYLFCADGLEEVEALTSVDLLRRAGCDVKTVSIMGRKAVNGAHGIQIEADMLFEEIEEEAEMLILPGGLPGTTNLKAHEGLAALLTSYYEKGRWVTAICAAPSVLEGLGFLEKRHATSYPGCIGERTGSYLEDAVVIDGNVVTSRGVGTAIPFALALITVLCGQEKAEEIAASILYRVED